MGQDLSISYALTGKGWSKCVVTAGNQSVEISASYLSDALGDLVLSAIAIASGFRIASFGFAEEPGEYRWIIEDVGQNLVRLRLLDFDELWANRPDEEGRELLNVTTTRLAFAKTVEACAAAVLREHGPEGYASKWSMHKFPEASLLLLSKAIDGLGK